MAIGTPGSNVTGAINTDVTAKKTVRFATDAPLDTNTYDNGPENDGVGATITIDADGVLADIDGITPVELDRVLVKDEASGLKNGFYIVSIIGDGATQAVLTRATDADQNAEVGANTNAFISEGTANEDTLLTLTTDDPIVIGTTDLTFDSPSGAGTPGGANGQVQFNDGGSFGGNSGFLYDKASGTVTVGGTGFTSTRMATKSADSSAASFSYIGQNLAGVFTFSINGLGNVGMGAISDSDYRLLLEDSGLEILKLQRNTSILTAGGQLSFWNQTADTTKVEYVNFQGRIESNANGNQSGFLSTNLASNGAFFERERLESDGKHISGNFTGADILGLPFSQVIKAVDGDFGAMGYHNSESNTGGSTNETITNFFVFGSVVGAQIRAGKIADFTSGANQRGFLDFYTNNAGAVTNQIRLDDIGDFDLLNGVYKAGGTPGLAAFTGVVTNITIKNGIVTAAS